MQGDPVDQRMRQALPEVEACSPRALAPKTPSGKSQFEYTSVAWLKRLESDRAIKGARVTMRDCVYEHWMNGLPRLGWQPGKPPIPLRVHLAGAAGGHQGIRVELTPDDRRGEMALKIPQVRLLLKRLGAAEDDQLLLLLDPDKSSKDELMVECKVFKKGEAVPPLPGTRASNKPRGLKRGAGGADNSAKRAAKGPSQADKRLALGEHPANSGTTSDPAISIGKRPIFRSYELAATNRDLRPRQQQQQPGGYVGMFADSEESEEEGEGEEEEEGEQEEEGVPASLAAALAAASPCHGKQAGAGPVAAPSAPETAAAVREAVAPQRQPSAQLRPPGSVLTALAMPLSSNSKCKGARPPHKRDPCYSLKVKKKDCKDVYIGVRDRHQAAVIADLKCVWKVCRHGSRGSGSLSIPPERLNFPEAGYGQDEELLAQLRALDTSEQLKSFALAVTELQPQEQHQFPSVWLPPVPSMQPQGDELRDAPPPQQVQQQHRQAQQQQQAQQQEQQQHRQAQQWQREQQQNRQAQQQEQQQEQQQPREVAATVQSAQQGSASGTERSLGNLANGLVENWTPQAAKVLAVADQPSPASVLRALRQLALTGHGGGTLLHIVEAWPRLTQHQVNYVSIAAQAAARSSWGQLECKLRLALKLASHSIGSTNNASACAGVGVPGNVPGAGEAAQGLPPFVPHFIISQAGAAFVAASSAHVAGGAEALRLPLDHLLLVDLGGSLLQETLRDWEKLGLPVQRFVMEAMLVATAQHAWEEMEKRLAAALALAE